MARLKKYWKLILFLLMGVTIFILFKIAQNRTARLNQELLDNGLKAKAVELKYKKQLRDEEDKNFMLRDSLRQEKINYTKLQNEKSRTKIIKLINSIPAASDSTKDSLWTAAWDKQDSLIY